MRFSVSAIIGIVIFCVFEIWFQQSPMEVRRFILEHLRDLPNGMPRWLFTHTDNIDQLAHYMFVSVSVLVSIIVFVVSQVFPTTENTIEN
jgi:hypothetical protein